MLFKEIDFRDSSFNSLGFLQINNFNVISGNLTYNRVDFLMNTIQKICDNIHYKSVVYIRANQDINQSIKYQSSKFFKDKIILISLPETFNHPNTHSKIYTELKELGAFLNSQVLVFTFSPMILSCCYYKEITLVEESNTGLIIKSLPENINGWTVERIMQLYMECENVRDPNTAKELGALFKIVKSNNHKSNEFENRFKKLVDNLGYADNDITSLRMEIELQNKDDEISN